MKIIGLSFEKSAELERMLLRHKISYYWEYSEGPTGCIAALYDIEIKELSKYNIMLNYNGNAISITVNLPDDDCACVTIIKEHFKEVILT